MVKDAALPQKQDETNCQRPVAAQYVDDKGQPSLDIRFNPNGSYAVESLSSPDAESWVKWATLKESAAPH